MRLNRRMLLRQCYTRCKTWRTDLAGYRCTLSGYTPKMDSYRDQALKLYPWICGRCAREFPSSRLRELTVHHRDGNHDNNPKDGSNWELLCIYCHENEHARMLDAAAGGGDEAKSQGAKHNPFAELAERLRQKRDRN